MVQSSNNFLLPRAIAYSSIFAASTAVSFLAPGFTQQSRAAWEDSPKTIVDQAWQIVYRSYVDPDFNQLDWLQVRQDLLSREYSSPSQAYAALQEVLEDLNDPYTRFMDPKQYKALTNQTTGQLVGIGIHLKTDALTGTLLVDKPLENSPASEAGLQAGDQIIAIDGQSTEGMNAREAAKLIRGEEGTEVVLNLVRDANPFQVSLQRARVEIPSVNYALKQENNNRVGYIRLTQFTSHAAREMRQAIRDLNRQGVDSFVLDLRGNPGGLLYASIDIARMWLDSGTIVRTTNRENHDESILANETALTDLPLAVLVDGNSASSSEILAGALQDNDRAVVIGTKTFGKALVQSLHPLDDGSGIAVTIAHYYTPDGTDISTRGVIPDIAVNLSRPQQRVLQREPESWGTTVDAQYSRAVDYLQTKTFAAPAQQPARLSGNVEALQ
jgi:carboxyl-terminal processing protease